MRSHIYSFTKGTGVFLLIVGIHNQLIFLGAIGLAIFMLSNTAQYKQLEVTK